MQVGFEVQAVPSEICGIQGTGFWVQGFPALGFQECKARVFGKGLEGNATM